MILALIAVVAVAAVLMILAAAYLPGDPEDYGK